MGRRYGEGRERMDEIHVYPFVQVIIRKPPIWALFLYCFTLAFIIHLN